MLGASAPILWTGAALGVSALVTTFFTASPHGQINALLLEVQFSQGLTWQVGGHVMTFGKLVAGLIELALVLAVALLVRRRPAHDPTAS